MLKCAVYFNEPAGQFIELSGERIHITHASNIIKSIDITKENINEVDMGFLSHPGVITINGDREAITAACSKIRNIQVIAV